jgi:hypothetical protein
VRVAHHGGNFNSLAVLNAGEQPFDAHRARGRERGDPNFANLRRGDNGRVRAGMRDAGDFENIAWLGPCAVRVIHKNAGGGILNKKSSLQRRVSGGDHAGD